MAFVAGELRPYVQDGFVGEFTSGLPRELARLGHRVVVVTPGYGAIDRSRHKLVELSFAVPVALGDRVETARFERDRVAGVEHVFVRHDEFFDRPSLYGDESGPYVDNAERFAFFTRAALAWLEESDLDPHVLHVHDWQAALVPAILSAEPERPLRGHCVLHIHQLREQGVFERSRFHELGLPRSYLSPEHFEQFGRVNLLKGGIVHAGALVTNSPSYCREIQTEEFGGGLEDPFRRRSNALHGIVNGLSDEGWSPQHDRYLKANFSDQDLVGKRSCKMDLQAELGLKPDVETPLVAVIGRLNQDRGVDVLAEALPELLRLGIQVVVVGSGERCHLERMASAAAEHPTQLRIQTRASGFLLHKVVAGADVHLVPSRSEPCAHEHLRAMRYGAVPVVRAVGALQDTVVALEDEPDGGTGFKFSGGTAADLVGAAADAVALFREHPERWQEVVARVMRKDFSWSAAARSYESLYRGL